MRIENAKERIILTEGETKILRIAKDIITNIYEETANDDVTEYTENILDNLDNLFIAQNDSREIVEEKKAKNGRMTFVTIQF